jgi:YebC/PmpR family DNA-binding regulatory protein
VSGHSKWSQIKRQKGVADVKRGQVFTKLGREITLAVRDGGPEPDGNARLRQVIQRARGSSMPMDTIERAIKRASGGGDGVSLEEISYEGYGPGGAAVLVEALTDNRNRAVAEIRSAFTRAGGSLGESGCVAWLFEPRGVIAVENSDRDPDELGLVAIDAGAEDVRVEDGVIGVLTQPPDLDAVRTALEADGVKVASAESALVPKTTVPLDEKNAAATLRLMEKLEDLDDVQRVYTNLELSEAALQAYQSG